jgi:Na+/melibiose symporter-like transporter
VANQLSISILWFSLYAQWIALTAVIVPRQVSDIAGHALQEFDTGCVLGFGALVALIVAPLAGALSDRTRGPLGRRRPFILVGTLASCVTLALLVPFGSGSSIWLYGAMFMLWQCAGNIAAGPYAGLVPDVVPERDRATASAWLVVMTVLGSGFGAAAAGQLIAPNRYANAYVVLIVTLLAGLAVTLARVREPAATGSVQPLGALAFFRSFFLDPATNRNFYWVLVTRLFANMGVWSVGAFFLFYVSDVVKLPAASATKIGSGIIAAGGVAALAAALAGAKLSQRYGRVVVASAGGWIMAVAAAFFVAIAFAPNPWLAGLAGVVYYSGFGAYQSVDWALALDVLPNLKDSGKDMGIWHVSLVLPQIVAPPTTGWLIYVLKTSVSTPFAYTVAFGIAALWFALGAALVGRVRIA